MGPFIWFLLFCPAWGKAQDSLPTPKEADEGVARSLPKAKDTLTQYRLTDSLRSRLAIFPAMPDECRTYGSAIGGYVVAHPFFPWLASPSYLLSRERPPSGMDWLFYTLLGGLTFFGLLRVGFGRYVSDLRVAFFDLAIRQTQIREQLSRQALPSQLMNLQFLFHTALFLHLLTPELRLPGISGHGMMIGMWMLVAAALYAGKQLLFGLAGWLAGKPVEAEGYLFIVMMVNKVAGVALIPVNILLAYQGEAFMGLLMAIVATLFFALLLLRILRCYEFVRHEFRIGLFPYLLFMGSFEVMPTLVAGKLFIGLFP